MNKNKQLDERLSRIEDLLASIYVKLENIEHISSANSGHCNKMGEHINFVENVYENVKHPLGFICNRVKYYTGNEDTNITLENS